MYRISLLVIATVFFGTFGYAQAFSGKGMKSIQIGIGLSEHHAWYPENGKGPKGHVTPNALNLNIQFEFGIAKYVGLAGSIGFDYASNLSRNTIGYGYYGSPLLGNAYGSSSFRSFAIPITFTGDFHFYQLIQDKTGKSLHADKLDIYAGLDFGSGPGFAVPKSAYKAYGSDVGYMIYGGPHVGVKYYFNEKIGVYLEAGYGKSYLNGGVNFKL